MRKLTVALVALSAGTALVCTGRRADAQSTFAHTSTLTVTKPLEVPGMVLQPGTYVLRVADTRSDRNVVEILNADQTKVLDVALTVPDEERKAKDQSEFVFYGNPAGSGPEVLRSWWRADSRFGHDFVYPHERAVELARATGLPVKAHAVPAVATREQLKAAPIETVAPPAPAERTAQAPKPAASTPAPAARVAESRLPKTASDVPFAAVSGLMAVMAAGALHLARRRASA